MGSVEDRMEAMIPGEDDGCMTAENTEILPCDALEVRDEGEDMDTRLGRNLLFRISTNVEPLSA
jgi:hypothetical protein